MNQPLLTVLFLIPLLMTYNLSSRCNGLAVTPSTRNSNAAGTAAARFITNKMCPYAQKAWIALEVTKAPYQMEQISLYGPNGKPDWFWQLNPKGTVPTLVCSDGTVFTESDDILNSIDQSFAEDITRTIVPTDPAAAARDREFRAKLGEFLPISKSAILGRSGSNEERMWAKLKELDSLIVGPYVCGDQITTADCAAFPFMWRLETEFGPVDGYGCNNIRTWLEVCQREKAFSKTIQKSWWWWW